MKKGIMLILVLLLTACTVTPKEAVEPLVDAKELAGLTLESAQEKYPDLEYFDVYELDGLKGELYTTGDKEFVFVGDGSKLSSFHMYPEEEYHIENLAGIYPALNIERNEDVSATGTIIMNPDQGELIREVSFTGDKPNFPMNVSILQIRFK